MKLIVKIFVMLIPVMALLGVIRVVILNISPTQFIPTWEDFLDKFSTMPANTAQYFQGALEEFMKAYNNMTDSFNFQWFNSTPNDVLQALKQFFDGFGLAMQAIGSFFNMIEGAFVFAFKMLYIPIDWAIWTFNFLFTA